MLAGARRLNLSLNSDPLKFCEPPSPLSVIEFVVPPEKSTLTEIEETELYNGADIEALCREAALLALRENIDAREVGKKHFDEALKKVNPSVDKETLDRYEEIEKAYLKNAKAGLVKEVPSYFG